MFKVGDWVYIKEDCDLGIEIVKKGEALIRKVIDIYPNHDGKGKPLYIVSEDHQCGFFEDNAYPLVLNNPLNKKLYPKRVEYGEWLVAPHIAQKMYLQKKRK